MKFRFPQPSPKETFDQNDTFLRKKLGLQLSNIVSETTEPLVISLEAQWGDGKTTFVYKWINQLAGRQFSIKSLYLDAYKCDHLDDAFLLISSEIYSFAKENLEEAEASKKFLACASQVAGAVAKGTFKAGLRAVTGGLFDGKSFDDIEKHIADELSDLSSKYIEQLIEKHDERRALIDNLSQSLTELAVKMNGNKPLILIIDELDRCRPDVALDLLETIKHLFEAKQVVFVLVNNSQQMEESVRARYGAGVDAGAYLRKFYDLTITLPRADKPDVNERMMSVFIKETFSHLDDNELFNPSEWNNPILLIVQRLSLSLRDIQKLISYIVIHGVMLNRRLTGNKNSEEVLDHLYVGMAALALKDRKLLNDLYKQTVDRNRVRDVLKIDMLNGAGDTESSNEKFDETWNRFLNQGYEVKGQDDFYKHLQGYHSVSRTLSNIAEGFLAIEI